MFCKKTTTVELPPIAKPTAKDTAQLKELNHEFFLLVRDQKYEQAYTVGTLYLQYFPENQAVHQFCHFIKHNREELKKMVREEEDYTDDSAEENEQQDEDEEDDEDNASETSNESCISSKASSIKPKSISSTSSATLKSLPKTQSRHTGGKQNAQLCRGHKWDHNCKNKDCPNRKKK